MLKWIRSLLRRRKAPGLAEWFHVRWDTVAVHIDVSPPGHDAWSASFEWSSIHRVCFKAEDMWVSDAVYVFTSQCRESYVIPTEADGGQAFWDEVLTRGLFDHDLAIKAVRASEGLFCWPVADREVR